MSKIIENYQKQNTAAAYPVYPQPVPQPSPAATGQATGNPAAPANYAITPGTSPVNINIYNPTVSTPGGNVAYSNITNQQPQPQQALLPQAYPKEYYLGSAAPASNIKPTTQPEEKPKKQYTKEVVQLSDDYIMSLENHLRSQNPSDRLNAAKELSQRFVEDDSRKNDASLTALLNQTLSENADKNVRLIGLSVLNTGKALGDKTTTELLNKLTQSKTSYGLDAQLASEINLKRAGKRVKIKTDEPPKQKTSAPPAANAV